MTLSLAVLVVAWVGALFFVYRAGRTWNDHLVAIVVTACFVFVEVLFGGPFAAAVGIAMFSLFWGVSQAGVGRATWWGIGVSSAWAYAFCLWGLASLPLYAIHLGTGRLPGWWWPAALVATWHVAWTVVHRWRVRREAVPGLPLRIVHLSDLHLHGLQHRRELDTIVAKTNALAPDLVLVTGDLLTPFSEADPSPLYDALRGIVAPTFCCLGNHDLPVRDALVSGLAKIGRPALVDERVMLDGVEIVGIDFRWSGLAAHVSELLSAFPPVPARYRILMAHDPRVGVVLPPGRFDLVLSGHTHGGQISAEAFGVPVSVLRLLGVRDHGWFGGTHRVHAGNWIFGLPPRLGVAPEILLLEPAPTAPRPGSAG